ncbi:MAG: hypothetical protein K2X03_21390 [Bryobacteraceae bacterium]|nr:hypothetical protein [Bryobacteraceae bacterium]
MKFITLILAALPLAAQANLTSKYMVLTTYHAKPGASADFADFLKHKWMPAMKKGGASPRIFSAAPIGGDASVFTMSSYVDTFAGYDNATSTLEKGAGAAAYGRMTAQRAQLIDSRVTTVLRRVPEMSVYREKPHDSPILLVQYTRNVGAKRAEFDALWKKEVLPAVKKAGQYVSVWRVALGDDLQYVITTPLESYAELDKGLSVAARALEPAAYSAFNEKVAPMVESTRREVRILRKDLMGIE